KTASYRRTLERSKGGGETERRKAEKAKGGKEPGAKPFATSRYTCRIRTHDMVERDPQSYTDEHSRCHQENYPHTAFWWVPRHCSDSPAVGFGVRVGIARLTRRQWWSLSWPSVPVGPASTYSPRREALEPHPSLCHPPPLPRTPQRCRWVGLRFVVATFPGACIEAVKPYLNSKLAHSHRTRVDYESSLGDVGGPGCIPHDTADTNARSPSLIQTKAT
ncbi:hypothetical protein GW17_00003305, partial [Ensete ventricosum]